MRGSLISAARRGEGVRARALLASAAVLLLVLAAAARAAPTAVVACGQVIVADTTLTHDLVNCPGDGIVIDAGVTLDLNGHSVTGRATSGVGIRILQGDPEVIIKNGRISGFGTGVRKSEGSEFGMTLRDLSVIRNRESGIAIFDFGSVSIESSRILHNGGTGALFVSGDGVRVTRTEIAGNGGSGIESVFAEPALYTNNNVHYNAGHGIFTDDATSRFLYNVASSNGGSGIYVFDDFERFFPYLFTGNTADRNGDWGIAFDKEGIIGDVDGGGNVARHNGNPAQCLNIACAATREAVRTEKPAPGDIHHRSR